MDPNDLRPVLRNWPYHPGQINVRRIRGTDNRIKIQMRLDLGVLQMEPTGRPDGQKPHDHESLLEYHRNRLDAHKRRNGTYLGFSLGSEEVRDLQEEAMQYYQRYLANFVLEEYDAVARDTQRNIEVLDFCLEYARDDEDRYALEPYRPYIIMMHTRSKALGAMKKQSFPVALMHVNQGLERIREFFRDYGDRKAYRYSAEVDILKALPREIRRNLPPDPARRTKRRLARALDEERYEDAARLRDELQHLLDRKNESKA